MLVTEIDRWKEKKEIMRKKSKLKKGLFIDDDLTKEKKGIQKKLRKRAREERAKGISARY